MMFTSTQKRLVIITAPVLLVGFSLAHGLDWVMAHGMSEFDPHGFLEWMTSIRRRWLWVHVAGLALFPLFGIAVWWMLPADGFASHVSRVALAAYIILYAAFDSLVGIGSAVLLDYRAGAPVEEHSVVDNVIWHLMGSDIPGLFGNIVSVSWAAGLLAAAVALWRQHGWRVSLPLAGAGGLMGWSHFPPHGTAAGVLFGVAVWQYYGHRRAPRKD